MLPDPSPSIFLSREAGFVATREDEEWRSRAGDREAWRWWSGGDGDGCLLDHVDAALPSTRYLGEGSESALWIGKEDEGAYRVALVHVARTRSASAAVIEAVVSSLWLGGAERIVASVGLRETSLLIALARASFLTDARASVDVGDPELADAVVRMTRFNPEILHRDGPAW